MRDEQLLVRQNTKFQRLTNGIPWIVGRYRIFYGGEGNFDLQSFAAQFACQFPGANLEEAPPPCMSGLQAHYLGCLWPRRGSQ